MVNMVRKMRISDVQGLDHINFSKIIMKEYSLVIKVTGEPVIGNPKVRTMRI